MVINEKGVLDWKTIMLDTSIIASLFNSENPKSTDDKITFIRELVDYLSDSDASDGKPRRFLIPSIVLTELLVKENDQAKIKRILRVLNSSNIEFIDFDVETALLFNYQLYPYLSKDQLHSFAKEFGFQTHDFMMAREWINRDFMIIMCGVSNKVDVILTADKKTFYPLTKKVNAFCALAYREYFEKPHRSVTKYYHAKVLEENKTKPQQFKKPEKQT